MVTRSAGVIDELERSRPGAAPRPPQRRDDASIQPGRRASVGGTGDALGVDQLLVRACDEPVPEWRTAAASHSHVAATRGAAEMYCTFRVILVQV